MRRCCLKTVEQRKYCQMSACQKTSWIMRKRFNEQIVRFRVNSNWSLISHEPPPSKHRLKVLSRNLRVVGRWMYPKITNSFLHLV